MPYTNADGYQGRIVAGSKTWRSRGKTSLPVGGVEPPPPAQAPNSPRSVTAVKAPTAPTSQINMTWLAPLVDATHDAHTGYRVLVNGTQVGADLGSTVTSHTITGLNSGGDYTVGVRAFNLTGASITVSLQVTLDGAATPVGTMLIGCSSSINDHGGTEVWDGWRVYTSGEMEDRANRTGAERPKFLAYNKYSANLGGSAPSRTQILAEVRTDLDSFYYNGTGQVRSARWGIKVYWSNGNENFDKGAIALPHTTAGIAAYVTSQQALYDAVHTIDPVTGARRYPDAFAGSNPTQNGEQSGLVADWLHPSARYHDFVMWSMYNPGREATSADPTYNWPTLLEADRYNLRLGFLGRCFYRTLDAQAAARAETGNPNFRLMIGAGEFGVGDNPNDSTTRPYYAVHGYLGGMQKLSNRTGLEMPFACWWDNQVADKAGVSQSQNVLGVGVGFRGLGEPTSTNPSTRQALQNWRAYNHEFGGTHPASWAGNPKATWKTTGPVT